MMSGSNCPSDMKSLFLSYDGRLNRQPFNIILGGLALISWVILPLLPFHAQLVYCIFLIALTLCPIIRRLHDREFSPWWYGFFFFVVLLSILLMTMPLSIVYEQFYLTFTAKAMHATVYSEQFYSSLFLSFLVVLGLIAYLLAIGWMAVELCFFRGTEGPNEYGPDPLEWSSSSSSKNSY